MQYTQFAGEQRFGRAKGHSLVGLWHFGHGVSMICFFLQKNPDPGPPQPCHVTPVLPVKDALGQGGVSLLLWYLPFVVQDHVRSDLISWRGSRRLPSLQLGELLSAHR